ncbi:DUF3800 domain-containing protein [Candidatus Gracilibacteria bacterium]|nr:DUF3800 domain-containing protein [Candidatus Gracilibacteria bacterium]
MQPSSPHTRYFFVDESGDPTFYDRHGELIVGQPGCAPLLILGFITTTNPEPIRHALAELKAEIKGDQYLAGIPSLAGSTLAFHAKDDCLEIREKVFKKIVTLDFKAQFVVGRKIERIFHKSHQSNPQVFYDDLTKHLFKNQLHLSAHNTIYFSKRGSKSREQIIAHVIQSAVNKFEEKHHYKNHNHHQIFDQTPSGEPCLQVVDYMLWALQRAYIKKEMRYMNFVSNKVSFVCDIYDRDKYPNSFYSKNNPFDITKISPL